MIFFRWLTSFSVLSLRFDNIAFQPGVFSAERIFGNVICKPVIIPVQMAEVPPDARRRLIAKKITQFRRPVVLRFLLELIQSPRTGCGHGKNVRADVDETCHQHLF